MHILMQKKVFEWSWWSELKIKMIFPPLLFLLKSWKSLQYQILFITNFLWKRGVGAEKKNNRNWTTAT